MRDAHTDKPHWTTRADSMCRRHSQIRAGCLLPTLLPLPQRSMVCQSTAQHATACRSTSPHHPPAAQACIAAATAQPRAQHMPVAERAQHSDACSPQQPVRVRSAAAAAAATNAAGPGPPPSHRPSRVHPFPTALKIWTSERAGCAASIKCSHDVACKPVEV